MWRFSCERLRLVEVSYEGPEAESKDCVQLWKFCTLSQTAVRVRNKISVDVFMCMCVCVCVCVRV